MEEKTTGFIPRSVVESIKKGYERKEDLMSKETIKLTKEQIKQCEDEVVLINLRLTELRNKVTDAERNLFHVNNIKESLVAALEKLEEAKEREEKKT